MGLPEFPTLPMPPPQEKLLLLLMESVALEELALAALVNAEAEKVQAVVGSGIVGPVSPETLSDINKAVGEVIKVAGEKEDRLLAKLKLLISVKEHPHHHSDD